MLDGESTLVGNNFSPHIHPSVERVFLQLGVRCEETMFYYFFHWFRLGPEDFHLHPVEFHRSMLAFFGGGAAYLEALIVQDAKLNDVLTVEERRFVDLLESTFPDHDAAEGSRGYWSPAC